MATNPVITISPANPAPGQTVTATVVYTPRTTTLTGTDQDGNVGMATFTAGSCGLTVSPSRTVTKVSDNGSTAVFTFPA
jgi:hypothetical protein